MVRLTEHGRAYHLSLNKEVELLCTTRSSTAPCYHRSDFASGRLGRVQYTHLVSVVVLLLSYHIFAMIISSVIR